MVERSISAEVRGVLYKDMTPSELERKLAELHDRRESLDKSLRQLQKSVAMLKAETTTPITFDGPYRTPQIPTPYDGDPELCGGCGGMHPFPIGNYCPGDPSATNVKTRLSFHADVLLINENRKLKDALEMEQWRMKRTAGIAVVFALLAFGLGMYLKLTSG